MIDGDFPLKVVQINNFGENFSARGEQLSGFFEGRALKTSFEIQIKINF